RPRRWLGDVLSGLAAASGIGYLAASYTVSVWLTKSSPGKPKLQPETLGLECESVACITADGLRLAGWVISPMTPAGEVASLRDLGKNATIAFFHGMRGNRGQMLARMAFLARAGYRCVAFDHRAHGESQGRRTSFGYYEARDVAA